MKSMKVNSHEVNENAKREEEKVENHAPRYLRSVHTVTYQNIEAINQPAQATLDRANTSLSLSERFSLESLVSRERERVEERGTTSFFVGACISQSML